MTPPEKRPYSAEIAGGQDLGLFDRFFDEEVVGARQQVVADVHAVEQEHVVVGDGARDRDLLAFGVLLVRPGANSATRASVRPIGMRFSSVEVKLV